MFHIIFTTNNHLTNHKSINQSIIFISGQLRLFVRGDNLTDARYTITRGYRMPGIEVVS